eukprot:272403_1
MSLFRRCQRFQPLIANSCKQTNTFPLVSRRFAGGHGHGSDGKAPPFTRFDVYKPYNDGEPQNLPIFIRPKNLSKDVPPWQECSSIFVILMGLWGYGLYIHAQPHEAH